MKLNTILLIILFSFCWNTYAGEGPEQAIEREITSKQTERSTAETQLRQRLQDERLSPEGEDAKNELDKELDKPVGERNEQTIKDLLSKIESDPQASNDVKSDAKTINGLSADIAALQKQEAEVQSLFTGAGGRPKVSFLDRVNLKFQEWGKKLLIKWGIGDANTLRSDLIDIYGKLGGDPLNAARQKQSLAQEMPVAIERVRVDLDSLNLLSEVKKTTDVAAIRKDIKRAVVDLLYLLDRLELNKQENNALVNEINDVLGKLLKPAELHQLLQTPEEETYSREFIKTFFDVPYMYDSFKSQRDSILADIRKDPMAALQSSAYENFQTTLEQLALTDFEQMVPDEQAYVASLVRSTYQMFADNFGNQGLKLAIQESLSPEETNNMIELFQRSNNAIEQAQAWDIHLRTALENGRRAIENISEYQKIAEANKSAHRIDASIVQIPNTVESNITSIEEQIDDPVKTAEMFDSVLTDFDEAIRSIYAADPSLIAVEGAAQLGNQASVLYNAIDNSTQEKDLSDDVLREDARRLIALGDRREQLLAVQNENQEALLQPVGNIVAEQPQMEKKNIPTTPQQVADPKWQALLDSIRAGRTLKEVKQDQGRTPKQQDTFTDNLFNAIKNRRNAMKGKTTVSGGGGGFGQ